jgi:hypothetical protein
VAAGFEQRYFEIEPGGSSAAHRWVNAGEEPRGFLCTVEAERDRPQPVDDAEWEALKADPATAPFIF